MTKLFLTVLSVVLLCVLGSAVSAATITGSTSYLDGLGNYSLSVAQFNPSFGVLNSVRIDLSTTFTATLTAYKTVDTNQYVTWAIEDPTILLNAPDNTPLISEGLGWIELVGTQYAPASGAARVVIPKLPQQYVDTKSLSGSYTQTIASGLSPFIGVGNVTLPCNADVPFFTLGTQGGNNVVSLATVVGTDLTVTYDYTPVPEPSSIIALIGGLGSLLALRRRTS